MISIHKIIALSAFNLFVLFSYAQKVPSTIEADRSFQSYSYDKAIKRYESISNKDIEVNRKLAEAYHKTGNLDKAELYLSSVANSLDAKANDVYNYFYVLRENGKYEESETWIKKCQGMQDADGRASLYASAAGTYKKLQKDEGYFSIKNLDINTDAQDFAATINNNKVVITSSRVLSSAVVRIWNWNNLPFLNLYEANKANDYELSGIKNFNKKLNAKYHEGTVVFSSDGKWMAFTRDNYKAKSKEGITKLEMYYCFLKDNKWQKEIAFPFNNKDYSVGHPTISQDGKTLYFVSDMPGGYGGTDIYKSILDESGKWGSPQNLGNKINTEGNEMFPFYHKSGVFYFSSDGHLGLGGLDVFALQIKVNGTISKIINLGAPINNSKDDFAFVMDNEEKGGYFSSNREGGKGDDDIYSFKILKALKFGQQIKGTVFDNEGSILANTAVSLYNSAGAILNTVITGENGTFTFEVDTPADYKLDGKKEKYFDGINHLNLVESSDLVIADLKLEKDPGFSLLALVTDNKTKEPLEGVAMKIIDTELNLTDYITSQSGDFRCALVGKKIGDNINYKIELKKDGYLSKIIDFKKVLVKPGELKVHEALDLSMGKIELGTDIGKLININPIYFDVNKFNIRKDAAFELDKIVKAMNEFPGMVIELGSHTDCRSAMAYNMNLSDKRAKSSAAYVISKGISKERIYGKGYGESKLINGCACEGNVKSTCTDGEHQANRRTEFIIVKLKG